MPSTAQNEKRTAGHPFSRTAETPELQEPRRALGLGVLSVRLFLAAVVIGVYCVKANEGLSIQHPNASEIYTELDQVQAQANYRDMFKPRNRLSIHELLKQQILLQNIRSNRFESQIAALQMEMKELQSRTSDYQRNCGRCLPGWDFNGSSCYFYSGSLPKKTWVDSREYCFSRGADLVVIDSWQEQQLLFNFLPQAPPSKKPWWDLDTCVYIGLSDAESEGSWVWVNDVAENGGYWIDGEPNNYQAEDCVGIFNRGNPRNTWFDVKCNISLCDWLCEMNPIT